MSYGSHQKEKKQKTKLVEKSGYHKNSTVTEWRLWLNFLTVPEQESDV